MSIVEQIDKSSDHLAAVGWRALSSLKLFRDVAPESVLPYLSGCQFREVGKGEIIIRPNRRNRHVFLVVDGELQVFLDLGDKHAVNIARRGDCVGELSIIDQGFPTAFVVAAAASRLAIVPHDLLWAMVDASHGVARNLLHTLAQRVRHDSKVIASRNEEIREYARSSTIDALTELHNRRWLEEVYPREVERCKRAGEPLSLVILDVDNFKGYNDQHGHLMGDEVLRAVSATLLRQVRPSDLAARYGGDEIVLLLVGRTLPEARAVAERIRAAVSQVRLSVQEEGRPPSPTLSLGVAVMRAGDTLRDLIRRADEALYCAKLAGRNCVRC